MNGFLWASGHLGWGIFAVAVFSGLWLLAADLVWRLRATHIRSFAAGIASGWFAGAALVVIGFYFY